MSKNTPVPLRLAVANSKGGVGKTTTAVVLAEVLADDGPTLLVDADTQGSATAWHRYATLGDMDATLGTLDAVSGWSGSVVIDTAPGGPELAREAYALVDLVIGRSGRHTGGGVVDDGSGSIVGPSRRPGGTRRSRLTCS